MYRLTANDLQQLPARFRARLINSLSGFKSANLVGTTNLSGTPNLAMVSSVVHLGANPPLLGMIMRPETVPRDTLSNIRDTSAWTLNAVPGSLVQAAHQCSASYAPDQSEFAAAGLTPVWRAQFAAPAVQECPLSLGLELRQIIPIELNDTRLVIGEISWLEIQQDALHADGYLDPELLDIVAISGLDGYHQTRRIGRLSYATPDSWPAWLPAEGAGDIKPPVQLDLFSSATRVRDT